MLKINETIDKNTLKASKEKEEKEPGYHRLEQHKKSFILHASALPPYDEQASSPTEFYINFLAKKSQFKAKEILLHRLNIDQVSLNPRHQLTACLWN
jgi:hypothetical protein